MIDPERFYRPGKKASKPWKIRNSNIEMPWPESQIKKSNVQMLKSDKKGIKPDNNDGSNRIVMLGGVTVLGFRSLLVF